MSERSILAVATMEDAARRERAVVHADASLMDVITRAASDPTTDVNKLERLMEMYERITANRAKVEFSAALAEMQDKLPVIAERGKIDLGKGKPQSYALWEDINDAIKPVLAAHGFALSFRTGRDSDKPTVTGILSHRGGHREETMLVLPLDTSGSKNAVQALGSSTSYGKRYTAAALLNLTSRLKDDRDDDGQAAAGSALVTEEQSVTLREMAESVGADLGKFCRYLRVDALAAIPAARFDEALAQLRRKGAAR